MNPLESVDPRPEPFVPSDCDVTKLPFMPLQFSLLDSDLWLESTGDEFKAALALWMRCWNQQPGGTLPTSDAKLAQLAGVSMSEWHRIRSVALHGWIECTDGRLHHRVVARHVLGAWIARVAVRRRSALGNLKRGRTVLPIQHFDDQKARAIACLARIDPDEATKRENGSRSEEGAPITSEEGRGEASEEEVEVEDCLLPDCLIARPTTSVLSIEQIAERVTRLTAGFDDVVSTDLDDEAWGAELIRFEAEGLDFDLDVLPAAHGFFRTHRRRSQRDATWAPIRVLNHPAIVERIAKRRVARTQSEGRGQ